MSAQMNRQSNDIRSNLASYLRNQKSAMRYKTLFKFGSWVLIVTAGFHSLSLIADSTPANETERQLLDLMQHYKMDMGAGMQRSMDDLVTFFSLSMSVLTLAIGVFNLLLARFFDNQVLAAKVMAFNAILWVLYLIPLYMLTFLPPMVCYSIAAAGFVAAWWQSRKG